MDLISGHSPSSSVSPPISPIKVFSQPGPSLPPLKNLPVWNRTGLEKTRFIRSITKDSPENTKTEFFVSHLTSKSTQTSPPSTAFTNLSQYHSETPLGDGNSTMVADKKLYFLQAEHEGVLKKLHVELEHLRNKNREMTFKLIMTNNGLSVSPDGKAVTELNQQHDSAKKRHQFSSTRKDSSDKKSDGRRDSFSKEETKRIKSTFKSAGNKSSGELDGKPETRSAKHNQSEERKAYQRHQSGKGALQQPTKTNDEVDGQHMLRNDPSMQTASALITGRQYSSEDYEEIIRDLKRLNAKQASELSHLKEKLSEQKGRNDDSHYASPNRLPKLDLRSASKSAKTNSGIRNKHEIVTLPALRPILGTKVTNRQRKAQASHVQRQRSNKDIVQKII